MSPKSTAELAELFSGSFAFSHIKIAASSADGELIPTVGSAFASRCLGVGSDESTARPVARSAFAGIGAGGRWLSAPRAGICGCSTTQNDWALSRVGSKSNRDRGSRDGAARQSLDRRSIDRRSIKPMLFGRRETRR